MGKQHLPNQWKHRPGSSMRVVCAVVFGIATALILPRFAHGAPSVAVPPGVEAADFDAVVSRFRLGDPTPGGPRIATVGGEAEAGASLLVTGANLGGADFEVWQNGRGVPAATVRNADDIAQLVLPASLDFSEGVAWLTAIQSDPVSGGRSGDAARLGEPVLWWGRVEPSGGVGASLRLFGRRLSVPGSEPRVAVRGDGDEVQILVADAVSAYELRVDLPFYPQGDLEAWVHAGTGGAAGWSDPARVVVPPEVRLPSRVIDIDPRRIRRDGFKAAVAEAAGRARLEPAGAVLRLPPGEFELADTLTLPGPTPLVLRGAGDGDVTRLSASRDFAGRELIRLTGRGATLEDLSICYDRARGAVSLLGPSQAIRRLRIERSPWSPPADAVYCATPGEAHAVIEDCEIRPTRLAVRVVVGTHGVRISRCRLVGRYHVGSGTDANAVTSFGNRVLFEDNVVTSEDRRGGQLFCRMVLFYMSESSHNVVTRNRAVDLGPHPSLPGIDLNTGETVLFHSRGRGPAQFREVVRSDGRGLELDAAVAPADGQIVWVTRGPGIGQYRQIVGREGTSVEVSAPWRVPPRPGDRVMVFQAARQNLIADNTVTVTLPLDPAELGVQRSGVTGWFGFVDNVIAGNEFGAMKYGVYLVSQVTRPSLRNLVVGNRIGPAHPPAVGYPDSRGVMLGVHRYAADHVAVDGPMGFGTRVERNHIRHVDTGIRLSWANDPPRWAAARYRGRPLAGSLADLVQGNVIEKTRHPVLLGSPQNRALVRENDWGRFGRVLFNDAQGLFDPLIDPPIEAAGSDTTDQPE